MPIKWRSTGELMPKFALKSILSRRAFLNGVPGGSRQYFRMPVDLFPRIDMPVVVVATFKRHAPQQIEANIK